MRQGIKCPVDGARVDDDACLACRTGEPRAGIHCQFPRELLLAMMDEGRREKVGVSATMLGGCRRQTWLKREEPWWLDPEKGWNALRGSIGHAILEGHQDPEALVEVRFEAETPWGPVSGQIDKLHPEARRITDFKTKAEDKKPVTRAQPDHVLQLNVYRWLAWHGWPMQAEVELPDGRTLRPGEPSRIAVDSLELVYWTFGWVRHVAVPTMPEEEILRYLEGGIRAWQAAAPPPVPPDLDPIGRGRRGPSILCERYCEVREACLRRLMDEE